MLCQSRVPSFVNMAYRRYKRAYRKRRKVSTRAIKRVVNSLAERKYSDISLSYENQLSGVGAEWNRIGTVPLNAVASGTAVFQRIGSKVKMRHIFIKFDMQPNLATGGTSVPFTTAYPAGLRIRFALVLDRESNGTSPLSGDIWAFSPQIVGDNGELWTFRNHDYAGRFKILKYFDFFMSPGAMCPCAAEYFRKIALTCDYKQTTGATDSDIWKNSITLWVAANTDPAPGTVTGIGSVFDYNIRFRVEYTDI